MSDTAARDVLAEAVHRRIIDGWNGDETTEELHKAGVDAGLAALREHGFAVVRTADVEAALFEVNDEDRHEALGRLEDAIR